MAPFAIALAVVLTTFVLEATATILNSRSIKPRPPKGFEDVYDMVKYENSQDYQRTTSEFTLISSIIQLALLLCFWFLGGFDWLHGLSQNWQLSDLVRGVLVVSIFAAASWIVGLPFHIYDTFSIEERFGFNKTTPATFVTDQIKSIALGALIGLPLIAGILWIFTNITNAWLWAWLGMTVFTLTLSYLAPRFIMPLFYKFTPLDEGELKTAINKMAASCDFPVTEVYVIDGSRRSSKANAFFTGFGKNRKIALFDTLVEKHSTEELVAVLAHEIGHCKLRHVVQQMILGVLQTGLLLFLLNFFITRPELYLAFKIDLGTGELPYHFGLLFFMILYGPVGILTGLITNKLSRVHEYQADAYAANVTGSPLALVSALKKLTADSLGNLTPHPFQVFMHYSHPPTPKRVAALEQLSASARN